MINFISPRSPFLQRQDVMPPLGLFYLVSVLRKARIESKVTDLGLNEIIPDGPTFITGTTPQYEEMLKCKRKYSVVGGPHASISHEQLKDKFSCVVVGEGESVIERIAKEFPTGVIFSPRIKNLDDIPFPDRSTCHKYSYTINGIPATTMITSRGCTGKCSFCCKAVMHNGIYLRSVQNILDEIVVVKHYGFNAIMFYDDSIAINKKRLVELCRGMKRFGITWRCFVRSDQVDSELFKIMADAGCYEVLIGVESGSNTILKNIQKQETVSQHLNAIKFAKDAGIKTKALMIAGLPGETWETIEESRQFILQARPCTLDITILNVYAGCDIYSNPSKYDIRFSDPMWYKGRNNEYRSTVRTSAMSEEEIVSARNSLWETFINL